MQFFTRKFPLRALPALIFGLISVGCADAAEQGEEEDLSTLSQDLSTSEDIPAALAVPEGNALAFWMPAKGVQVYSCKQGATGAYAWTFVEPDANLYGPFGKVVLGHHYAGPTWELIDGSSVVGAKIAGVTVDASAVPWLLLQSVSHAGKGLMTKVTYIQRLSTVGGLAPTGGCDETQAGAEADVPYTAVYAFYRARNN